MSVEVTPSKLNVDPELVGRRLVVRVGALVHERGLAELPLVRAEEDDVCARGVHLVTLTRMDRLLLDRLDLQGFQLLIEDLTLLGRRNC